jgi:hypothetical protein
MSYQSEVSNKAQAGANLVRRELAVQNQAPSPTRAGGRLNTNVLPRTLISARSGYRNKDRYVHPKRKPSVNCAWSFAIDGSDSMSYRNNTPEGNYWKECVALLHALHSSSQKIGVHSQSALVFFEGSWNTECAVGSSTNVRPVAKVIKAFHEPWKESYCEPLKRVKMGGGTSLVSYAEVAIDMVRQSNAKKKVAFFLTDGDSRDKVYLESLRRQALWEGITLVGIGLGTSGNRLPNGVTARNAIELAPLLMSHILSVLKGNGTSSIETSPF